MTAPATDDIVRLDLDGVKLRGGAQDHESRHCGR